MNKKLKPGQTWNPILRVYDVAEDETETARDCTGETAVWIFKRSKDETAAEIKRLTVNWTDQSSGVGYFSLDYETSKALTSNYWHQVILYETASMTVVQPFGIYKLIMEPTLEKDLP